MRAHQDLRVEVKGLRKLEQRDRARRERTSERRGQEALDEAGGRRNVPGRGKNFPADPFPATAARTVERPSERPRASLERRRGSV